MALKKGAFDALDTTQHEHKYLPGAPVSQAYEKQEQEKVRSRNFTADAGNKPSFIPLATSQGQHVPQFSALSRTAASPEASQADSQPLKDSNTVQPRTQISTEDYTKPPHLVAAPTTASAQQLPHNGHVPLVYPNSGLPGHGLITSNILMYPPSQIHFTQAGERGASTARPQMTAAGAPSFPQVQNQPASPGKGVATTGPPTAWALHSPHRQMPGQSGSNAQMQVLSGQPEILNTAQPMSGVLQWSSKPHQTASPRLSQETPPSVPQEDPRLASPKHSKEPESIRQVGAAGDPQQVHAHTAPKMEHTSKSKSFAPVSRAMIGAFPANHQLRERLQNLANRQKTLTAKTGEQDDSSRQNKGQAAGKVHECAR